ncbi:glycosyltransferase family 2 protein [Candidatus Woesearchaeota archaeon]|nr:glycosyltransferase family 2 protein [Candidatus Woesearchaeota archaeon]
MGVSVVLPAYNEEENIKRAVKTIESKLKKLSEKYEIIVVDDGSRDNTGKILDGIASRTVKVIHQKNKGVGRALMAGFRQAKMSFITHNSADLPFDESELKEIFPMFKKGADVVVVVRKDRSANSPYRALTSWGNNLIIRTLFGVRIKDLNFVQVYRKEVIDSIRVEARDLFIPPELVIKTMHKGYKVGQYRANFYPREKGKAKYGKPRQIIATFKDQLYFWWKWKLLNRWG